MRRIAAIMLLVSFVVPLTLPGVFLEWTRSGIRREAAAFLAEGMEENEQVRLRFTLEELNSSLRWEHPFEFEYQGIMYDVIRMDTTGYLADIWCYKDLKETAFNNQRKKLARDMQQPDTPGTDALAMLQQFLSHLYCMDLPDLWLLPAGSPGMQVPYLRNWETRQPLPRHPPPKYC